MAKTKQHPEKAIKTTINLPQKDNMDNFNIFMVISFFVFTSYIVACFHFLDLSIFQLVKLYCLFIGLSFLLPIKIYRKKLTMSFYEYVIFNILSFAPILIGTAFFLNNTFKGPTYVETYQVVNFVPQKMHTVYELEGNAYADKEYLRSIKQGDDVEVIGSSRLSIYFSDGLFGLRIIEKKLLH